MSAQRRGAARPGEAHALVGRRDEVSALASRLEALANGRGGALLIEGEAGMGKTTLFARLLELARAHGVPVHAGYADPIEANTPYYPLRAALASVLGIDPDAAPDPSTYRATVEAAIAALDEEDRPLGPLIGAVLPVDLPQTELTAQMSGAIRAENLAHLLLALLREAARSGPFVLALEDLHWLDSASWALCRRAADELPNVLLVATLRPIELPPAELDPLTSGEGRALVRLDAMDESELVELVKRRLGCDALPVALKRLIARRAEGNPFFAEELALALSESGAIVVEDGSCTVASSALDTASLPGTVQGVITSRVDRLAPQVQLTLKVASVVGRSFSDPMVAGIHPKGVDATEIREQLEPAERAGLVVREGLRGYAFRHALTHETTYGLMSGQQRAPLHLAAAEWLEARYSEDLAPYYGRLAHHLSEAEQSERALDYLGLAGQQALDAWANQAARDYFARAIAIDERLRGGLSVDLRRARWNERLAEAHYSLIEFDEARACCERAIRLSGFPKPKFGVTTPFEVMKHVMGRWTRPSAPATGELRERCVVALRAADLLQVVCLWEGDKLSLAHTVFEGTNIARRLGPAPESAFAKAMVGYLLMLSGLHDVAERDLLRGVEMADASGALLQRCSTHMYLGLSYSALGRLDEALAHLTEADEIAGRLGAGLWKHRGKYMRAEATMMSGRLEEAAELFRWCAIYASGAEPPIVGFAHAMQAICLLEAGGAVEDSLAIIEGPQGIQLVRDNPMVLQLYNCLACVIECCRETGDYARAVEAAEEALALAEQGDDCNMYMTGYNGHSAIAGLYLELWERALAGEAIEGAPPVAELRARLDRAIAQLTAGRKLFPAVRTRELLYLGAKHRIDGRARKAQRALREAAQLASRMQMPFEEAAACLELGRLATGDERATWLARADEVAGAAGLRRLSRRIEAARAAG